MEAIVELAKTEPLAVLCPAAGFAIMLMCIGSRIEGYLKYLGQSKLDCSQRENDEQESDSEE